MLELHIDSNDDKIVVTLNELLTIVVDPYYLFIFENVLTKAVVAIVYGEDDDESLYPDRYNQFKVDTAVLFDGQQRGEWHYKAYQQVSSTNLDPTLSGSMIENGKMILYTDQNFDYNKYNESTVYTTYNG